jgi:lysophospholipase L1-like esterase
VTSGLAKRGQLRYLLLASATIAGSSLAVLAAFEGSLRVYDRLKELRVRTALPAPGQRCLIPSADPQLGFELNPGWSDGSFSVNSLGMADAETSVDKPDGVRRIVFVGDSISCNFGQRPRAEIYLEILERMLNERAVDGVRFECLNFGVNGYGILQALHMARTRVPRFRPDLLVAQLGLNDPYPSDTLYERSAPDPLPRSWQFFWRRLHPARFWAYTYVGRNYDKQGFENVRRGAQGLSRIRADLGLPVLLVLFPYLHRPAYESWGFNRYEGAFHDAARESGLPLLDLRPHFSNAGLIDDRWPKDPVHPDARGHLTAAEALLDELAGRGPLRGLIRLE